MKSLVVLNPLKDKPCKVTAHFGITPGAIAKGSHILDLIEKYCINKDIIDEVEENQTEETAEVLRIKLEFEHEERRLAHDEAHEEAQRAQEAVEAEAHRAREAAEAEAQKAHNAARDLRLAELRESSELLELELKPKQEKAILEAEKEAAACEHELQMARLGRHPPPDRTSAFDPARNIRLVSPFQEKEVDKYFASCIFRKFNYRVLRVSVRVRVCVCGCVFLHDS